MRTRLQEEKRQPCVILLPSHQPVRFDVTLPATIELPRQFVRAVLYGQGTVLCKLGDDILNQSEV